MDRERTVQVVLGEAERTGILRFVLEGEGFDIIGMASSDEELERVLVGARPSVIVLDGGISAAAALAARERATGASMVLVWPAGVAAVLADERVDPHLVIEELGAAVRKASERAKDMSAPIRIPEFLEAAPPIEELRVGPASANQGGTREPARLSRAGSRVLVAVATWIVALTALATIAVAVPRAFELFDEDRTPRRSPSPAETRRPDDRTVATGSERSGETGRSGRCEPPRGAGGRADWSRDPEATADRANGCPQDGGSRAGGDRGQGASGKPDDLGSQGNKGKPDDPGSQGNKGKPDDPGSQGNKGKPDDPGSQGNKGDQGNKGEVTGNRGGAEGQEHPSDGRFADDEKHESGSDKQKGAAPIVSAIRAAAAMRDPIETR